MPTAGSGAPPKSERRTDSANFMYAVPNCKSANIFQPVTAIPSKGWGDFSGLGNADYGGNGGYTSCLRGMYMGYDIEAQPSMHIWEVPQSLAVGDQGPPHGHGKSHTRTHLQSQRQQPPETGNCTGGQGPPARRRPSAETGPTALRKKLFAAHQNGHHHPAHAAL